MKKQIVGKVLLCIVTVVLILCSNYILFELSLRNKIDLRTVFVAKEEIPPRSKITEDMLLEMKIPGGYVVNHTYEKKKDIVGKYTDIQGKIPAGSPFYIGMLVKESHMPDGGTAQLKNGQVSYVIQADATQLSGMVAGMRVDVYGSTQGQDGTTVQGCLLEHARIVSIKDHQGLSIENEKSNGIPSFIEIAIQKEHIDMLSKVDANGTLRLFTSSSSYSDEEEAEVPEDSELLEFLTQ